MEQGGTPLAEGGRACDVTAGPAVIGRRPPSCRVTSRRVRACVGVARHSDWRALLPPGRPVWRALAPRDLAHLGRSLRQLWANFFTDLSCTFLIDILLICY